MLITTRQEGIVKGYQSPAEHARQVALVKESLKRSKHCGAVTYRMSQGSVNFPLDATVRHR
jgi:hypothetical protein